MATPPPRRPPPTHFLSIPLNTPAALPALQSALDDLAALLTPRPLPPTAIRPAVTLHLTLGVMSLPTPAHVEAAVALLASLDLPAILRSVAAPPPPTFPSTPAPTSTTTGECPPAAEEEPSPPPPPPPLKITLRGLATFGPPRRATVLYAVPHDGTGRLRRFAEHVRGCFAAAGMLAPEPRERPLLLHATVVNTVYVRGRGRGGGGGNGRVTFDAGEALAWGRGRVLAEGVEVERVCVCRMGEVVEEGVSRGYLEVGRGMVGSGGE